MTRKTTRKKWTVKWDVPFLPENYEKNIEQWVKAGADNKYRDPFFERILKAKQPRLKKMAVKFLEERGYDPMIGNGYVYAAGKIPILLVAHMDTVHERIPKNLVYRDHYLTCPEGIGGDDRCGIYMILEITRKLNCHVLFTEDEEHGCIGAGLFRSSSIAKALAGTLDYIIELDRRGKTDAVFYECGNRDFINYITANTYFTEQYGSFSDICVIAPALNASAVNFSCGYFNEHSKQEYIDLKQMNKNISEVKRLIKHHGNDHFEWRESPLTWDSYAGYAGGFFDGFMEPGTYEIKWRGKVYDVIEAYSKYEAIGMFLTEYPDLTSKEIDVAEVFI